MMQFMLPIVCADVFTSLDVSILYSYTGDYNDPQAALSGVKYTYTSQSIVSGVSLALYCLWAGRKMNIIPCVLD